ncbi:MAG TPA: type II toxin-antitoxin system PemK/MazF family toxin [Abditibacterium sp.]|jgi:hypothetical protein
MRALRQAISSSGDSARKRANTINDDLKPGDVVVALLPGARETKRRPAIVVSTPDYHAARPDVLLAIVTSRVEDADTAFDCVLFDWRAAGLRTPCAMRSYLFTIEQS